MKFKELIIDNKIDYAFEYLVKKIPPDDFEIDKAVTLLRSRFNKINKDKILGVISQADVEAKNSEIIYSLLTLYHEIEKESGGIPKKEEKLLVTLATNRNISVDLNIEQAITYHLKEVDNWSKLVKFSDASKDKQISKVYVDLDYYVTPRRLHFGEPHQNKFISLSEMLTTTTTHIAILGQPGAGKTTTMKRMVQDMITTEQRKIVDTMYQFPIVLRLRDLNEQKTNASNYSHLIVRNICAKLGISFSIRLFETIVLDNRISKAKSEEKAKENEYKNEFNRAFFTRAVLSFIEDLKALIILDGFDELNYNTKDTVLSEIKESCMFLNHSRVIVTSRTADFQKSMDNLSVFEICPLTNHQINLFISQWLDNEQGTADMIEQINKSPFNDTTIRPLTLAHLCALYERYQQIPEKPKSIYRKIVNLLLEEWDAQRAISRKSKYSRFEVDRKFEFLSHFSFTLTRKFKKSIFSPTEMRESYKEICSNFGLPEDEDKYVIEELETHTGLFIQSGYSKFEFAHKSIQEYLTAEYIVKLPFVLDDLNLLSLPSEIALATALSSNPTIYFCSIIFQKVRGLISHNNTYSFFNSYFQRLLIEKPDFESNELIPISIHFIFTLTKSIKTLGQVDITNFVEAFKSEIFIKDISLCYEVCIHPDYGTIYNNYSLQISYGLSKGELVDLFYNLKEKDVLLLRRKKGVNFGSFFNPPEFLLTLRKWVED